MILIDKPFVSEFLIETIKENKFQIISTAMARELIHDDSLNWISEVEAKDIFKNNPNTLLYTNSENSISWIENNLTFTTLPNQIHIFKNKIKFRELLKETFPTYFFKGVKYEQLKYLDISNFKFPFIIKPSVGFFSLGVHKVDSLNVWSEILLEIESDISKLEGLYPNEVIDVTDFIIEEYFEGEEYAIDCYFNGIGEPVILNILHHVFSSASDVSDRIYSTSKDIIEKNKDGIQKFLKTIGIKTNLINFPAHVEVRIDNEGQIFPIEINPLRFGGWCTTADLSWFAFGFNSYEYFLTQQIPNWRNIFKLKEDKKYSIIVLDNNSGIKGNDIESFDYEMLLSDFQLPLDLRKANFSKFPVFGFLFVETQVGNDSELTNILTSNLRKYIKVKQ
ncbi:MAG: ATP-grasp domain-containing protein [Ignavibacteriales bacterium CG18_big_fil_WC_8_21_14_2_50_31_20]|nr:MAG: ATP-grasp domain-containing protein [Ignavibacteriales bacterium CG18_big_fil_WC_8_21_14_2_50_31_20]